MSTLLAFQKHGTGSSLKPNAEYALSKDAKKSSFLGMFLKTYTGVDPTSLFMRLLFSAHPDATAIPLTRLKLRRPEKNAEGAEEESSGRTSLNSWAKVRRLDDHIGRFASVRKVLGADGHFEIHLPLCKVDQLAATWKLFSSSTVATDILQEFSVGRKIPASVILQNGKFPAHVAGMLKECLVGLEVRNRYVYCVLKAQPTECEYMTNTDWVTIRPVDMHPLIAAWADAAYVPKKYGKSATSVTRIARSLPATKAEDRQVDQHNLAISSDGLPLYIPAEHDSTEKYETMLSSVGGNSDGSFSLASDDDVENMRKAKLPVNIPVLTDWVNLKFAYTDSNGNIQVLPLEHVRKCTAASALNVIRRDGGSFEGVTPLISFLQSAASRIGVTAKMSNYVSYGDFAPQPGINLAFLENNKDLPIADVYGAFIGKLANGSKEERLAVANYRDLTSDPNYDFYRPLVRFIRAVVPAMETNIERLNVDYAVTTVMLKLGMAKMLNAYGGQMSETQAQADTQKKASLSQSIDPNWTPPDAPLITKNFETDGGLLPHQARVRNLLKDSPDIAVIDVKAGGGKSLLSITDILYEIKANRSAPYLLMCPGHLVPNYVSEIVEFTDGSVNVIPFTTDNIKSSGYARYEQILEAAPLNTVLVVDYGVLKYGQQSAVYGTATVTVFPVVEMIRKFKPGYAMMDESHMLKNLKTATSIAVRSLVAAIPKKRIATGTLSPDSPSDLPGQLALLDPSIVGDKEEFNTRFAHPEIKYSGSGRVTRWMPNAGGIVMGTVKQNAVWCTAKRREWAAALPPRTDRMIKVTLTPRQRECYDALFDDMVASLKAEASKDKKARALLEKLTGKKASKQDEDDFGDLGDDEAGDSGDTVEDLLDDSNDIGAALQPHISALERFVSNPADHPYAMNGWVRVDEETGQETRHPPLTGDDLRSPKAVELEARIREWLSTKTSKVIVFANQKPSVRALWEQLPDDLRAQGLMYEAGDKVSLINKFKTNPKVRWMIGIRHSMEVGLNLQAAGYLIRVEGCWNPGEQEQGDSRVERPKFGEGGDKRDMLLFDTIVADATIDVTKAARLRAKMLAVAKFENPTDEAYQAIPDIPVFKMTLDNIRTMNDFDSNIKQYQDSMSLLNRVIKDDYAAYRKEIEEQGGFKLTNIKRAPTPPECALLSRVPYAKGTDLYSKEELGLVRLDNYLGNDVVDVSDEDDSADEGDGGGGKDDALVQAQLAKIVGMRCHTEVGDGVIIGGGSRSKSVGVDRVTVRLDDGSLISQGWATKVFVVTRKETNSVDMRNKLAKAAGLPVTGEITVPAPIVKLRPLTKKERLEQEAVRKEEERRNAKAKKKQKAAMSVGLHLSIVNGYMRIAYDDGDKDAIAALQSVGFKYDQPYVETRLRNHAHLIKQARVWAEAGFNTTKEVDNDSLALLAQELATGALRTAKHYVRTTGSFANYMRKMFKPQPDKMMLNIFGIVTDGGLSDPRNNKKAEKEGTTPAYGIAYLCLPYGAAFPATRLAISPKYKVPGTMWYIVENNVSMFVNSLDAAKKVVEDLELLGVTVSNKDELNKAVRSVRKVMPKSDSTLDLIVE